MESGVDLRVVARRQRWLVWMALAVLGTIILTCMPLYQYGMIVLVVVGFLRIAIHIALLIGVVLILSSMRTHVAITVICGVLMLIPLVNLIVLVFVNQSATGKLKRAGMRVGFMGVSDEEGLRKTNPHLCKGCGYNLTGNVSGRCPECGLDLPRATPVVPHTPVDGRQA